MGEDLPAGVAVPVFFSDGERETGIGDAVVSPSLQFRELQLGLSQRIGLSPNQFSVFFVERRRYRSWPRKVQVTAKFNFASVAGDKESYFLVVLKRSRRERAAKRFGDFENVVLLRREDGPVDPRFAGYSPIPAADPFGYERRVMELKVDNESYFSRMVVRSDPVFCDECERSAREGSGAGFHWCANDAVTSGFRSRAGPIARPVKK